MQPQQSRPTGSAARGFSSDQSACSNTLSQQQLLNCAFCPKMVKAELTKPN